MSVGRCEVEEEEEDPHKGDKQISQSARVRRPLGGVECIILFSVIPCLMAASKDGVESVKTSFLQRDSVSVGRCGVEEEEEEEDPPRR
jgi:hypothetical protein